MTVQPAAVYPPGTAYQGQPNGYRPAVHLGLSWLVHAHAKAGKSAFGDTSPAPRLTLDAEGGSRFTLSRKREWNPSREPLPAPAASRMTAGYGRPSFTPQWETLWVNVQEARQVSEIWRTLNSGHHYLNSLVFDSITEVQQRMIDDLAGRAQMSRDDWGALLRQMNVMARRFRDLINHPVRPLWSVCFIAGTHEYNGKLRPLLQGQVRDYMPYYVDLLGYIEPVQDGTRFLLTGPHPRYETGERIGGRLPHTMKLADPFGGQPGWDIQSSLMQVIRSFS